MKNGNKEHCLTIPVNQFGTLSICAIRYCQWRETYMPDLVREIIFPHLRELSDTDISVLMRDCEDQRKYGRYGSVTIDKPGWLRWEKQIKEEFLRRESENE